MRRSWVALAILGLALLLGLAARSSMSPVGQRIWFSISYLFIILFVLSYFWTWVNVNGVEIIRQTHAEHTQVGGVVEERFVVHNATFLPKLWLEVRDHSTLPHHHTSRVIASLGSRQRRGWTVRTFCRRRGRFILGPLTIISGDPFGLFERRRELSDTSTIVVYPATVDLPRFAIPIGDLPGGGTMRRRTHYVTTNVAGVRDYYPGDSFHRIHWPSTARTGRLIVKEFELDPTADVWLFVDMQSRVHFGLVTEEIEVPEPALLAKKPTSLMDPTTEEYTVTIAASLAKHFLSENRAVGLVAYAQQRQVLPADRGERQLSKILEMLAVTRAQGTIPLATILSAEGAMLGRNTSVVAITPSAEVEWVEVLRDLSRRDIRGVAVVIDPESFGGPVGTEPLLAVLAQNGLPAYRVRQGDDLRVVLSQRAWWEGV
ncbi:MAG: DUF58 domain-containing protein [Chloroflexi bacterium]|nr:DUF58 domain-containing protein [Chloroflexota bacterium]